ncbi:MAG TPA: hypothetical protein VFZ53_02975 [Polyangiaceae bacterium]
MIAKKRGAVLSLAVVALFGACTVQSSTVEPASPPPPASDAPPLAPAPAAPSAPPASPPPASPSADTKAPTPLVPAVRRKGARPRTETECRTCNGAWGVHGLSQKPDCNCRTSDAGKRCRDGVECEALCVAAETPEREITEPGSPPRGFWVGKCSEFATVFGCYRPIEDGAGAKPVALAEPPQMLCVD